MSKTIATAGSVQGIEAALNSYFYSEAYRVDTDTLVVSNSLFPAWRIKELGLEVEAVRGRYILTMED